MMMRGRFIAGSEQEMASVVRALQTAGYRVTELSNQEIEVDLPSLPAERGLETDGCGAQSDIETSVPQDFVDSDLVQPDDSQTDHPSDVGEREFVLAPHFRKIATAISARSLRLYHGSRRGWSALLQHLQSAWQTLSKKTSKVRNQVEHASVSLTRNARTHRSEPIPRRLRIEEARIRLETSRRTVDRLTGSLGGALAMAGLIIAYIVLDARAPTRSVPAQTVQGISGLAAAPGVAPWTAAVGSPPKLASSAKPNRRISASHRESTGAEDDFQEVIVRQFPQRRTQPPVAQFARPKRISDIEE
jgi:hypothetical protein